ncbi:MAG: hypothetical protein ACYC6L_06230 [Anaerolineae bacterium]
MRTRSSRRFLFTSLLLLTALLLAACQPAATPTTAPVGSLTAAPSPTPSAKPAAEPSVTPTEKPIPTDQFVKVALIALEDNGASGGLVGCGDSVVLVDVMAIGSAEPVQAALEALLAIKEQSYGESGLYNSLYRANLTIESIEVVGDAVNVALTGTLNLGGVCDDPRAEAQLVETARVNANVKEAFVTLNGIPIHEALSQK